MTIVSFLSKHVLNFLGWTAVPEKDLDKFKNNQKSVCVFSNTSYFDYFLLLLYNLNIYENFSKSAFIVKCPKFLDIPIVGRFLRSLNIIQFIENDENFVKDTVKILNTKNIEYVYISPETSENKWSPEYYHIAKEINSRLVCVGLDYETKKFYKGQERDFDNLEEIEIKLRTDMSAMMPLYPEKSSVLIRNKISNEILRAVNSEIICNKLSIISLFFKIFGLCLYLPTFLISLGITNWYYSTKNTSFYEILITSQLFIGWIFGNSNPKLTLAISVMLHFYIDYMKNK